MTKDNGAVPTNDTSPGIRRVRRGSGFRYVDAKNRVIRDSRRLDWIRKLAIPPAWEEVWISPKPEAKLLATGRDAKGRKQYRYHPAFRAKQDRSKYARLVSFAKALPLIRRRIKKDIKRRGLGREKVLAAVVMLLEKTRIRVGSEEYARKNGSYGLTTLQNRHAEVAGSSVKFSFKGKSGKYHTVEIVDRSIAPIVRDCRKIPGKDLFQYLDDQGVRHDVTANDVNTYLREITGAELSAKDFRTWSGTLLAALALNELERFDSEARNKRNVREAIESVAKDLGNTPTICRSCYIHPSIIDSYLDGTLLDAMRKEAMSRLKSKLRGLRPEEALVLAFLEERLERESAGRRKRSGD